MSEEKPRLVVRPHPSDPMGMRANLVGYQGNDPVEVDFGDGARRERIRRPGRHDSPVQHTYPGTGCFMVTAQTEKGALVARQQVVVRGTLQVECVQVAEDDGGIRVTFTDTEDRSGVLPFLRIEWQDGDNEHSWAVPGLSVRHDAVPGKHEVRIIDTTSGRAASFPVEVSEGTGADPDFTVGRDRADESGMTVVVRLDAVQNRPVHIYWDDADGPQIVEHPTVGMEIPHPYTWPGHYLQTVTYAGQTSFARSKSEAMTVPAINAPEAHNGPVEEQAPHIETPVPPADGAPDVSPADPGRRHLRGGPVDVELPHSPAGGADPAGAQRGAEPLVPEQSTGHQHDPAIAPDANSGGELNPAAVNDR